jgi:hypothetical protein
MPNSSDRPNEYDTDSPKDSWLNRALERRKAEGAVDPTAPAARFSSSL